MATKLFLRSTTWSGVTGLPTTEQHTGLTSDGNADAQSVNRTLSTTKGSSQAFLSVISIQTTSQREYYFSKFVSDELATQTINAQTWTINLAATSDYSHANFPNSGSGPLEINCYVWRPSTSTKVGTVKQGATSTNVDEATGTERVKQATFSGSSVSVSGGDRLVLELWAIISQSHLVDADDRFYYNGTTENSTAEASVSNHASYLNSPQTLSFGGAGGGTLVSQTSIHKYNVLTNTPTLVSATSIHKYHVNPRTGFTLFARLFVPYANNQFVFGRRSTLFSKIDTDQVDYAYSVQMDDLGNMYWFVRSGGRENWIKADGIVDPILFNTYDFTNLDYNSADYYTQDHLPPLPSPIPFVDVAFTYAIADRRMQIIKNGSIVSDTDMAPLPSGLVGRWVMDEKAGIVIGNRISDKPGGTISNATWTAVNNTTYLRFDGNNDNVQIPNYAEIQNNTAFTVSLWYYPQSAPTTDGYLVTKKPAFGTNSWLIYHQTTGFVSFSIWNGASTRVNATFSSAFPTLNQWYHVVAKVTLDSNSKIFVNNVKVTSATPVTGTLDTGETILQMGGTGVGSTPTGLIRDVCIWDRELSDSEITTIYNTGESYPLTSGLVGHWMMNEGGDIGDTPILPTDFLSIVRNGVRVFGATNGTITNASWTTIDDMIHEPFLEFVNSGDKVLINSYTAIQNLPEITVSIWYRHGGNASIWRGLIWKGAVNGPSTWLIYIEATSTVRFTTWNNSSTRRDAIHTGPTLVTDQWYHFVGRYKLSTGEQSITVDNVKFSNNGITGTMDTGSGTQVNIGRGWTDTNFAVGMIYDVRIWNRYLSDGEVSYIYNQGIAHAGFPAWHKDPDPPPDVPVPITNPFVEVYNVSTPSEPNQELVRLHAVIASGFEEEYDVGLGSSVAAQNPPFATILDQPPTGGGGGGGSPETNYDVSQSSSSHLEFEDSRSRWAILVNSGASVIGKIVTKMTFRGRRYGSSSLGTVTARIWKAGGGTQDIGSTSASGWSSSDADQATFENTGNGYACVQGDRIGFEISWSPSSSNSIECSQIDSTTSGYTTQFYDGGWSNSGHTGISMGMKVESGSATGGNDVNIVWPPFNEICFGCPAGANGIRSYGIRIPSGSSLIGKKPTRVTFHLKKVGTPSGNMICYIQRNGGATSVQFGAPLDVSTLTGTLTAKEFTDTGNGGDAGYALQTNDRIYFLWQSSNTTSYVVTQRLTGTTTGDAIETAYGDSDPAPTSTIMGWFNTSSNDACIKVEEGGFNIAAKDPWYELNNVNTRIGERLKSTGSPLNNMKITRVTVRLKAIMSPTGSIFVKIRDASNTERAQLGIIDASMVSTTDFDDYTVTNIYQDFVLQDEWGVFLEWSGGTSVNKIQVNVKHEGADQTPPDSAANSLVVVYSGAYTEVAADLSGKMFTGGSSTDPAARIRVGEKVALDTSSLRLKKISRAELQIKRTGPIVPGSVYLRIRDPEDDSIMATVGELEAISIPTSMSTQTFTKIPVSTVAIPTLGILTVEYDDGDDDNYVEVMVSKVNAFDDTAKTYLVKYDDLLGAYETTFTTYDLVGKLEEGGDTFTPSADEIPPPEPPTYDHDLLIFAGGHEWGYGDEPQNWLNAVAPDVRIYWKLLSIQELMNIYINRIDRQNINFGDVARTGYFSMPEQA